MESNFNIDGHFYKCMSNTGHYAYLSAPGFFTLYFLNICMIVLIVSNLFFGCFNIYNYIYPLQRSNYFIQLFYLLALVQ